MRPTHQVVLLRRLLIAVAALLIVGGALLTVSAPKPSLVNNKADAYGGPVPTKPTNPKTKTECVKYYGANATVEARECEAQASRYVATKRCAKKKGAAAQKACRKAASKAYAKARTKIAAQRTAEKVCSDAYMAAANQLNPEDPEYTQKSGQLVTVLTACLAKARG